ncbi:hypothetical protein B0H13DRAFT_1933474 [Mycena leptocephala]|nr:hypothetical protein B0H13DRAFT_1933474 [Mycena leptocephala]
MPTACRHPWYTYIFGLSARSAERCARLEEVRSIAAVTTAVAKGDLSKQIEYLDADAPGAGATCLPLRCSGTRTEPSPPSLPSPSPLLLPPSLPLPSPLFPPTFFLPFLTLTHPPPPTGLRERRDPRPQEHGERHGAKVADVGGGGDAGYVGGGFFAFSDFGGEEKGGWGMGEEESEEWRGPEMEIMRWACVGNQGKLGGEATVPDVEGVWFELVTNRLHCGAKFLFASSSAWVFSIFLVYITCQTALLTRLQDVRLVRAAMSMDKRRVHVGTQPFGPAHASEA